MTGYELLAGHASGSYEYSLDVGPSTAVALPALVAGQPHYFAVRAYDDFGGVSALSNEVLVAQFDGDAMPLAASFTASPRIGVAPLAVRFTPTVSGALLWYRWEPGDGSSHAAGATLPLPAFMHTYERPGVYSATLTIAGPAGQLQSAPVTVDVQDLAHSDGCPCSFWGTDEPVVADDGGDAPVSVGLRFSTLRSGVVTAIRFYKSPANAGPHVGELWTAAGELLGSVSFTAETASGWQRADFAEPVPIAAHADYVVSYHAPRGHVPWDSGAFLKPVTAGPLIAAAHRTTAANGLHVHGPPATFPRHGDKQVNHWVDVVFVPTDRPGGVNDLGFPGASKRLFSVR